MEKINLHFQMSLCASYREGVEIDLRVVSASCRQRHHCHLRTDCYEELKGETRSEPHVITFWIWLRQRPRLLVKLPLLIY